VSFAQQERALFDLLFDQTLRDDFCNRRNAALTGYELTAAELGDFDPIRPDGLRLDASLRADQRLVHLCRQFPVSFGLLSSARNGMELLRKLINLQTMRCATPQRAGQFGAQLQQYLSEKPAAVEFEFADPASHSTMMPLLLSVVAAELGMAWTAADLRQLTLAGANPGPPTQSSNPDWTTLPLTLAAHVSACLLPHAYSTLKTTLIPAADSRLWAHLSQQPVTQSTLTSALKNPSATLLVTRAWVSNMTPCEVRIDHKTVELSEGFAPLLQQVNGSLSVNQIIRQLNDLGATPRVLDGVKNGFRQLLESSMIVIG